jgi:hypothetical protein
LFLKWIADRLDGKAPQAIECGEVPIERLTDAQLYGRYRSCSTFAALSGYRLTL